MKDHQIKIQFSITDEPQATREIEVKTLEPSAVLNQIFSTPMIIEPTGAELICKDKAWLFTKDDVFVLQWKVL